MPRKDFCSNNYIRVTYYHGFINSEVVIIHVQAVYTFERLIQCKGGTISRRRHSLLQKYRRKQV